MRNKLLTCALVVSIAAHFLIAGIVGRTFASRLNNNPGIDMPMEHLVKVDLVQDPEEEPVPEAPQPPESQIEDVQPNHAEHPAHILPLPRRPQPVGVRPQPTPTNTTHNQNHQPPGNPGGELNTGTPSAHGDIPGTWNNGKTAVGWVPGNAGGTGQGSGTDPGVGRPEPDPGASSGTNTSPNPPPPAPKTVRVKVCKISGLLPGKYCEHTLTKTYVDGKQPTRTCDKCKAPPKHTSTLADRKNPQLVKSVNPVVPLSVPEGLSLQVKVRYTVTETGSVTGVEVVSSSRNRSVDKAVVKAASQLKYKPAVQNGKPRSVTMTRTYKINT